MMGSTMRITTHYAGLERDLANLFESTFSDSEGAAEGRLIGQLVSELLATTPAQDLSVFIAEDPPDGEPIAAVFFTRLLYERDDRVVSLLSPMAVRTDRQRQGVGQELLSRALEALREEGIDIVVTYGDPAFYRHLGFEPVDVRLVPAPFELSQPAGWLALSLGGNTISALPRSVQCVRALNRPAYW